MSHFTVTVALPGTVAPDDIETELAKAMAPFDEDLKVPRYVKYTREQLIEKGRQEIEGYKRTRYAEYLRDPAAYAKECGNLRHLTYLAGGDEAAAEVPGVAERVAELIANLHVASADYASRYREWDDAYVPMQYADSFPAKLDWTDAEVHTNELRFIEDSDIGEDGEVYSERNPQTQWDYYSIGGRWAGYWKTLEQAADTTELSHAAWANRAFPLSGPDKEYVDERTARPGLWVDVARKYDIDFAASDSEDRGTSATFAFLDSEGKWHEKGSMGWWGIITDERAQEEWDAEYARLIAAEADNAWFVLVDCHF